jgi:mRNA interferase MazF
MAYKRGDVLLVPFPFTDLSATKVRPCVVVSSVAYHRTQPDIVLAAITSNVKRATDTFDYVLQDWQSAGLKFPSAFKPVIFTLDPNRALHRAGNVSKRDLAVIDEKLRGALSL